MSTIKSWRMGNGVDGEDEPEQLTKAAFEEYDALADDCEGGWIIYWRQNMPGLDNLAKDDSEEPIKNWWPFLFY